MSRGDGLCVCNITVGVVWCCCRHDIAQWFRSVCVYVGGSVGGGGGEQRSHGNRWIYRYMLC